MNDKLSTLQASISQVNKVTYRLVSKNDRNDDSIIIEKKVMLDQVIVEQPLQVTLQWYDNSIKHVEAQTKVFAITMRTPGYDKQLILGLLLSEGIISHLDDINFISNNEQQHENDNQQKPSNVGLNEWLVILSKSVNPKLSSLERFQLTYSSCGLCGSTSIKSLELKHPKQLCDEKNWLTLSSIFTFTNIMRDKQKISDITGSAHAAMLFDKNNQLLGLFEDIGRHNAVDKVIGHRLLVEKNQLKKSEKIKQQSLIVSSRLSFEMVQKTILAGIPILIGMGAPSNLAILTAKRFDLTLIGFCSDNSFNVYHGQWRLKSTSKN